MCSRPTNTEPPLDIGLRHAVSCGVIRNGGRLGRNCPKAALEALEEGGYVATSPDLAGLVAQGRTVSETVEIAHDVARKIIESYEEHGDPLPVGIRKPSKEMDIEEKGRKRRKVSDLNT